MEHVDIVSKYGLSEEEFEKASSRIEEGSAILYAMSGKMGSGKDTIGDRISESFSEVKFKKLSFATPIRIEIDSILKDYKIGRDLESLSYKYNACCLDILRLISLLEDSSIYERSSNSREAIQHWGTDVRRVHDINYWTKKMANLIVSEINNGYSIYVSDVRFPNEAETVYDLNGKVIRLSVPSDVRASRIEHRDGIEPTLRQLEHSTETGLDNYPFEINYNGLGNPEFITIAALSHILQE